MDLMEFISGFGAWAWVLGGIIMMAIELIAPGGFFLWLGGAAILTGLIGLIIPFGWAVESALFGILAIASLAGWLRFSRARPMITDRPFLNARAARYVGQSHKLHDAISGGFGTIKIGEAIWRVSGEDMPSGQKVTVTGFEGAILQVVADEHPTS